ncbi:alkaline phosphatase family protein [Solimicrobium silvestre]|uniref:Phosphoesterase family n=1 Tax=Solimicrobium silvestre TaxID=2099400 RepID=A0A2S9GXQ1_9BURK|nr:alkaline phosphatase family protein [Solimicrobium silvestre]PRC92488.1 Phosphoesterase family [Solimicrobium silvestre]
MYSFKNLTSLVAGFIILCGVGLVAGCNTQSTPVTTTAQNSIKHVFVITLENKNFSSTFGNSTQDTYLQGTLVPMGALLTQYYGTGHVSLDNYVSMISGQPSSLATQTDCAEYQDFSLSSTDSNGIATGTGCVYPASVKTLPDLLTAANLSWRGYMEDMGNDPTRESAACGHPALNTRDLTQSPEAPTTAVPNGDQYATRHNPFMYFHTIIDSPSCATNVVALPQLKKDLAAASSTPNFVFITPNLCHDGHDGDGTGTAGKGCVNGEPGGLTSIDAFLKEWVPLIMASPAYQQDGMIVINFDEGAPPTPAVTMVSGIPTLTLTYPGAPCCGQQTGPNVTRPYITDYPASAATGGMPVQLSYAGIGGDQTGAVLISPFIKPGTVSNTPYNHYSLLKSLQDIYSVTPYLGYASQPGLVGFGSDVYVKSN